MQRASTQMNFERLTGRQKAGILLVALGPEASANIFKHINEDEVESLSLEIADLDVIPKTVRAQVIEEFYQLAVAQDYISKGGIQYAKDLLKTSLGQAKAQDVIRRVQGALEKRDFQLLRNVDPGQLVNFLQNEHPQTIALILSHLESRQAADILGRLREDIQADVGYRIATMESVAPEVVRSVEKILETKTRNLSLKDTNAGDGIDSMVQILLESDRTTEKRILETIEEEDVNTAMEIRNQMFVFEDLIFLEDRSIQRLLRDIETQDLVMALKAASTELRDHIFKNMSTRAATSLGEELEVMGPVKLKIVEEAQQKIVAVVRKLEDEGEVAGVTRGGGGDELVY